MSDELYTLDAYKGKAHITEAQLAAINRATYGDADCVLSEGREFEAEIIDNNTVRIYDGVIVQDGIRGGIEAGGYRDALIQTGTQAMYRNDIVVVRWRVNSENANIKEQIVDTVKGAPVEAEGDVVDPVINTGLIHDGALVHDTALYRIKLKGLNIEAVEPMFKVAPTISELEEECSKINSNLSYEAGSITMKGTPVGCNAAVASGEYTRIGKLVFFNVELTVGNNGTGSTAISIPCLPFKNAQHCAFTVGYHNLIVKTNATDENTTLKAGAYSNSDNIVLFETSGGRDFGVTQKDIISGSGNIVISGHYATE